jgi:hypothetical protein
MQQQRQQQQQQQQCWQGCGRAVRAVFANSGNSHTPADGHALKSSWKQFGQVLTLCCAVLCRAVSQVVPPKFTGSADITILEMREAVSAQAHAGTAAAAAAGAGLVVLAGPKRNTA